MFTSLKKSLANLVSQLQSFASGLRSSAGAAGRSASGAIGSGLRTVSGSLKSGAGQLASIGALGLNLPRSITGTGTKSTPSLKTRVGEGLTEEQTKNAYNVLGKYTKGQPPLTVPVKPTTVVTDKTAGVSNNGIQVSDYTSNSYNPNYATTLSNPPTNVNVSSENLGAGSQSMVTPSAPVGTNYLGQAIGGNVSVGGSPETGYFPTVTTGEETGTQQTSQQLFDSYIKSLKEPANQEELYNKAYDESGLKAAQQRRNNTQNQINGITAKMNSDLLQLRGTAAKEGVTEAVYGGQQAEVTREATIQLLPLQAQLAADQSNLELAQQHLDTLYGIYSKDAQNSADFYNDNVKTIYNFLTTQEKNRADAITKQKDFQASILKDEIKQQRDDANQALKDGNSVLYKSLTSLRPPVNVNSPTFDRDYQNYLTEKANIMARYGGIGGTQIVGLTPDQQQDPFVKLLASTAGGKRLTDTSVQKLDKALGVLGQLGLLQTNVANTKTGPIIGAFRGANPWDTNAQTIKAQLNAIVPNLARGVYGEVGVLTDNDIKTYAQTLPNLKSTEDVRNAVLGITLDMVSKSVKRTLEVNAANKADVSGFIDLYTEMINTRDSIFSQIPGYKGYGTKSLQDIGVSKDEEAAFDSIVGSGGSGGGFFSNLWRGLFGQ